MVATPVEVRRAGLQSMRRLLPRMQLAGRASAVLHPLIRILSGPADDLRREVTIGAPYPVLAFTRKTTALWVPANWRPVDGVLTGVRDLAVLSPMR